MRTTVILAVILVILNTVDGQERSLRHREAPQDNKAVTIEPAQQQEHPRFQQPEANMMVKDQKTTQESGVEIDSPKQQEEMPPSVPNRRKFVGYESSAWEKLWLENVERWTEEGTICKVLLEDQIAFLHHFLNITCTSRLHPPFDDWCVMDDALHPLWYNHETNELTFERPVPLIVGIPPPRAVVPDAKRDGRIMSKFVFFDETTGEIYTEHIEPLVAHLRFPLYKCAHPNPITPQYKYHYAAFRGWLVPPPPVVRADRAVLFDASTGAWESHAGGSPKFFSEVWSRHGVQLDEIFLFHPDKEAMPDFYHDLPAAEKNITHFVPKKLAGRRENHAPETPFLPLYMREHATQTNYVIVKMNLDSHGRYDHLAYLNTPQENIVDELVWEHHAQSIYVMEESRALTTDLRLPQSYDLFLMLRKQGIRAHAWV